MKAYRILNQKDFTSQLFLSEAFDHFLVTEATIVTSFTSRFDGRLTVPAEDGGEFIPWSVLRPVALSLIKGKVLPRSIHLVLKLTRENTNKTVTSLDLGIDPGTVAGLFLNIRYEAEAFTIVTGSAYQSFSPDRTLDPAWAEVVRRFLNFHKLTYEEC